MNFSRKLRSKFQSRLGHAKPDKDVPSPPETFRSKPSNIATTPHFMEPLKNQTPIGATVGHGLKNVLEIATEAADAFGPLKSTLSGLRAILKAFEQYSGNKEKLDTIVKRLESLEVWDAGFDQNEREFIRRKNLQMQLNHVLEQLDGMSEQGRMERLANSAHDEGALSGYVEDIRDALIDYQVSLQQQLLQIDLETMEKVELGLLNQLPRARGAGYTAGDRQKCLRGTRSDVLKHIHAWAVDPDNHRVYWLNGLAGTGKSTISQSVAEDLFAEGRLGASFFCSRDFADRSDIHLIFPTIAFDLACRYPAFRAALLHIITTTPDIGNASLSSQLQRLLIEPLRLAGISTIIIIDALDECKDKESASVVLSLLARHMDSIPSIKFFITGRPEPRIRSGFRLPLMKPHTEVMLLHEIEPTVVDQDIRLYLKTQLPKIVQNRSGVDISRPWPSDHEIDVLVRKSGGLFIFASTTCRFVASEHGHPHNLVRKIVDLPDNTANEGTMGIDQLYTRILEDNYASAPRTLEITERLQTILGAVVLLFNPLSRASMSTLLCIETDEIWTSLRLLHSLVLVPDYEKSTTPIRIFHKSLPDYLTDQKRCTSPQFYIQPSVHHLKLAICCLQLMNANLKKNICNLPRYVMNQEVGDLYTRRRECIGDALEYACRFWAKHLCLADNVGDDLRDVTALLQEFMAHNFLSWLEVLSICDELRIAAAALHDVQGCIAKVFNLSYDLLVPFKDGERFLLRFFDPIQKSAAHIYDSVLVWSPESSWVRERYRHQGADVKLVNAIDHSWGNCTLKIGVGTGISCASFSHSGDLVGCCGGATLPAYVLKIFETATGSLHAEFDVRETQVNCLAFSPDDTILVTDSVHRNVSVWDVPTGALVKVLHGHNGDITVVAFSPSAILASGDSEGKIRLWNVDSGQCLSIMEVGECELWSIRWSPKDNEIAVARKEAAWPHGTIDLWDTRTQKTRMANFAKCDFGSTAYSPDGSKLASSDQSMITIWDVQTGDIIQATSTPHLVTSNVSFSPCGRRIAYGTDHSLDVWDSDHNTIRSVCKTGRVSSVAFSPDGTSVSTTALFDPVLRIWSVDEAETEYSCLIGNNDPEFMALYMSWDGKCVVSIPGDGPMKLWDAVTGLCLMTFIDPNTELDVETEPNTTFSAAISNDMSLLASISFGKLRMWSCTMGTIVKTIQFDTFRYPTSLRISPNGRQVVAIFNRVTMVLWDVETEEEIYSVDLSITRGSLLINEYGDFVQNPGHEPAPPSSRKWLALEELLISGIASSSSEPPLEEHHTWNLESSYVGPMIDYAPIPESHVPVIDDPFIRKSAPQYSMTDAGWIEDLNGRRVFWVAEDTRVGLMEWYGKRLFLGTYSGGVVIMDILDGP